MSGLNKTDPGVLREKAEWYKEVLDLEPGSKVFFPYAKLLVQLNQSAEAAAVLLSGLDRHPEFTEARLLLISILHQRGEEDLCSRQIERLADLFGDYPSFWDAWSLHSQQNGQKPDLGLSLSMLGAMLREQDLTLVEVMNRGLRNVQASEPDSSRSSAIPAPRPAPKISEADECRVSIPDASKSARATPKYSDETEAAPEKSSLRTRSMAEVLAEQGDVRGAMDIYRELLENTEDEQEKFELTEAMESLKFRIGQDQQPAMHVASASSKPKNAAALPQSGVVDLLEKLALRLENKAKQQ